MTKKALAKFEKENAWSWDSLKNGPPKTQQKKKKNIVEVASIENRTKKKRRRNSVEDVDNVGE